MIASGRAGWAGWAYGLTKCLARRDPFECINWTLNFLLPFKIEAGGYGEVIERNASVLKHVLAEPDTATLARVEGAAWEAWHIRNVTRDGNSLARLLWATMGAVELARPGWFAGSDLAGREDPKKDPKESAEGIVWQQSACAIHVRAYDEPNTPTDSAHAFTVAMTRQDVPPNCKVVECFEWAWEDIYYGISLLRSSEDVFYIQFIDRQGEGQLFSGPFSTQVEVTTNLESLKPPLNPARLVKVE
jgi:hypothetical protein